MAAQLVACRAVLSSTELVRGLTLQYVLCLLHLFFNPEDGGSVVLRTVGGHRVKGKMTAIFCNLAGRCRQVPQTERAAALQACARHLLVPCVVSPLLRGRSRIPYIPS
jgi:hypothetical protein